MKGEGKGTITLNTWVHSHETFSISATSVTFNGAEVGFDSSKTECRDASNLVPETFSHNVAELIVDDSLASSIASYLSSYTELPMESC